MIDQKIEEDIKKQKKLLRVYPKAFAIDEKLSQSLAIFEDAKARVSFSLTLGSPEEIANLVKDSTQSNYNAGYSLSSKILECFSAKPKKAIIRSESRVDICIKQDEIRGFKKIQTSIGEMLGLWNLHGFPIYSESEFIDSVRQIDLKSEKETSQPSGDLYRVYGQKYLM
jgi:hypothetical protein